MSANLKFNIVFALSKLLSSFLLMEGVVSTSVNLILQTFSVHFSVGTSLSLSFNIFSLELLAPNPFSIRGCSHAALFNMVAIGQCQPHVSSSVRRLFCSLVKQAFLNQFGFRCPQNLHRVKDLSFLPHLMNVSVPWRHILLRELQTFLHVLPEQWEACLASPNLHIAENRQLYRIGQKLLDYRIGVCQAVPTRLKMAFSWNMNSWQYPKSSREDHKVGRIKKLLKSGPVLLQETKWCRNQEEILFRHISGLQLATTKAIATVGDCFGWGCHVDASRMGYYSTHCSSSRTCCCCSRE